MIHALRHHWRAFETDNPAVTMFIGPSTKGVPLEIGVVTDDAGAAVIHAIPARSKFLKGWWIPRPQPAPNEHLPSNNGPTRWSPTSCEWLITEALRAIAELVDQRQHVDTELTRAVRSAKNAHRSWAEIRAMLGVSKQAAQRKYGDKASRSSATARTHGSDRPT
jgi:hypothetical protein